MPAEYAVRCFVQARMSSARFPGKVLAPFRGRPIVMHVVEAVVRAGAPVTVLTSTEPSDDPLASYLRDQGVDVFRGPLQNVFERFRLCARERPARRILRVSADSPLLSPDVLRKVVAQSAKLDVDLITTVFPRTFPKGHNAELIRTSTLEAIDVHELTDQDREHVTPYFYRNAARFRIVNVESGRPELANHSLVVDSVDDLRRLEALMVRCGGEVSYEWLLSQA